MVRSDILVICVLASDLYTSTRWRITVTPIENIMRIKFGKECPVTGSPAHRKSARTPNIISINKGAGLCLYLEEPATRKDMDLGMFSPNYSVTPLHSLDVG